MNLKDFEVGQRAICKRYGSAFIASPAHLKVGISENAKLGIVPINGLRHGPEGDTTGWYIWCGEAFSQADDFFVSLHVSHLHEWCPEVTCPRLFGPGLS